MSEDTPGPLLQLSGRCPSGLRLMPEIAMGTAHRWTSRGSYEKPFCPLNIRSLWLVRDAKGKEGSGEWAVGKL
jgi:hypothetical protein